MRRHLDLALSGRVGGDLTVAVISFEELLQDRSDYIRIARKNGLEEGLRNLLSELYPDNAHFIYEILQNAEDARATTVDFSLQADRLVVTHDGARPFSQHLKA